ncbi:MAG TPA: Tad domain-containing protein [Tepidisphaeraceae bacterium]|jgi:hypothetical protein
MMQRSNIAFQRGRNRSGLAVIYVGILFVVLIAFVAFAVDVGRMRMARSELQTAADASARGGASGLPFSTAATKNRATSTASANSCLGEKVQLQLADDVAIGIWHDSDKTFSVLPNDRLREGNAVRVDTRRISARSTPVKLFFAPVLGIFKNDIETQATAYIKGDRMSGYGIVGIQGVDFNGNPSTVNAYDASKGPYSANNTIYQGGSVASNGNITVGNGNIDGDVRAGGSISSGPNADVTGWKAPLDTPLSYPPVTTTPSPSTKLPIGQGGKNGGGNDPILLAGSNDPKNPKIWSFSGTARVNGDIYVTGYNAVYIDGNLDFAGNGITGLNGAPIDPMQFRVYVIGNHKVSIGGIHTQYMELYAPGSDVTVQGSADYYGSIIGKTVTVGGGSQIHYDLSRKRTTGPEFQIALKR